MVSEKLFVVLLQCRNSCLVSFLHAKPKKVGLTQLTQQVRRITGREIGQVSGIQYRDAANHPDSMLKTKQSLNHSSIRSCYFDVPCPTLVQTPLEIVRWRRAAWLNSPATASDPCPLLSKRLTFENLCCQNRMMHQSSSQFGLKQTENKEQSIHNGHGITSAKSKNSVVVKVKDLENYLRIRGYSTLRVGIAILLVTGFGIYMFREPIRENISDEVADVASRSLGDQNVMLRANEISKAIINQVLTDPATVELTTNFVTKLLEDEEVVKNAVALVTAVVNDEETQRNLNKVAAYTLQNLLDAESTRTLLLNYIRGLLADNYTKQACKELLDRLAADRETKQILADFFKRVLDSDTVTNQAVTLGKDVTKQIVADKVIQEETGMALWTAFKMTFTPSWLLTKEDSGNAQELKSKKLEPGRT